MKRERGNFTGWSAGANGFSPVHVRFGRRLVFTRFFLAGHVRASCGTTAEFSLNRWSHLEKSFLLFIDVCMNVFFLFVLNRRDHFHCALPVFLVLLVFICLSRES